MHDTRQPFVVSYHNKRDRNLLVQIHQEGFDFLRRRRVQVTCRFISKNNRGISRDRPSDCHSLLLAAAEFPRSVIETVFEPDTSEKLLCPRRGLGWHGTSDQAGHHYIFESREIREKMVELERPIIVRDLFRHTAGFTYGTGMPEAFGTHYKREQMLYTERGMFPPKMSIARAAEGLARIPLLHQPGERFTYGLNVDLLGRLIEIWSEKPLDEYFKETIFEPLGMPDTGFFVPAHKANRFVSCHGKEEDKLIVVDKAEESPYLSKPDFLSGGGGLVSTMEDYARFCQALVNLGELDGTRILDESTVRLMFTNQLAPATGSLRFGLGFAIQEISLGSGDHERTALAYRWGGYANTAFQVVPSEGMAQVFMRQLIPSNHRVAKKLFPIVYQGTQ